MNRCCFLDLAGMLTPLVFDGEPVWYDLAELFCVFLAAESHGL